LLPNTAGFIDPLHSSGIAHSLSGIERLALCLQRDWRTDRLPSSLEKYSRTVWQELAHIDRLVAGCFLCLGRFPLLAAYSMLYFAAATEYERRRRDRSELPGAFLRADDPPFVALVQDAYDELATIVSLPEESGQWSRFENRLLEKLKPYNHVGLGDRSVQNMYRYTAADLNGVV
jgi:FADH2 O2-dependent halogenase